MLVSRACTVVPAHRRAVVPLSKICQQPKQARRAPRLVLLGHRCDRLDGHPVVLERRRDRRRVGQSLHHIAARLSIAQQPRDPLRRLLRINLQVDIHALASAVHRMVQQRTTTTESSIHINPRSVHRDLHHLSVPDNLGQQSERYRKCHIPHGRRRSISPAQPFRLIAEHRELVGVPLFRHTCQRLRINVNRNDPSALPVVWLPAWWVRHSHFLPYTQRELPQYYQPQTSRPEPRRTQEYEVTSAAQAPKRPETPRNAKVNRWHCCNPKASSTATTNARP